MRDVCDKMRVSINYINVIIIYIQIYQSAPLHYLSGKFIPIWGVSTSSGSYIVDFLGKLDLYE